MENRIRELVKAKGLKMSDLANRCGMTQSNLISSIRNNPKLSTLEQIAEALGIKVSDIIDPERAINEMGIVVIDGQTYVLSKPSPMVVQIPAYANYGVLRDDVKRFVSSCIKNNADAALCGLVETFEYFNIFFDCENKKFNLNLCYGKGQMITILYDLMEYGFETETWSLAYLCQMMINDIEGAVLMKFGTKKDTEAVSQENFDSVLKNSD